MGREIHSEVLRCIDLQHDQVNCKIRVIFQGIFPLISNSSRRITGRENAMLLGYPRRIQSSDDMTNDVISDRVNRGKRDRLID